jgi:hypothetical protein
MTEFPDLIYHLSEFMSPRNRASEGLENYIGAKLFFVSRRFIKNGKSGSRGHHYMVPRSFCDRMDRGSSHVLVYSQTLTRKTITQDKQRTASKPVTEVCQNSAGIFGAHSYLWTAFGLANERWSTKPVQSGVTLVYIRHSRCMHGNRNVIDRFPSLHSNRWKNDKSDTTNAAKPPTASASRVTQGAETSGDHSTPRRNTLASSRGIHGDSCAILNDQRKLEKGVDYAPRLLLGEQ